MLGQDIEISVVSPVYMAEDLLDELVDRLTVVLDSMSVKYEIILVEDRGNDNSWEVISRLAKKFLTIRAYRLSRNFGQHYAITAGLSKLTGKWVVVLDCDPQIKPDLIEVI